MFNIKAQDQKLTEQEFSMANEIHDIATKHNIIAYFRLLTILKTDYKERQDLLRFAIDKHWFCSWLCESARLEEFEKGRKEWHRSQINENKSKTQEQTKQEIINILQKWQEETTKNTKTTIENFIKDYSDKLIPLEKVIKTS